MYDVWEPLHTVAVAYENGSPEAASHGLGGYLNAAAEAVVDALAGASSENLRRGAEAAKLAHDRIVAVEAVDRSTPAYLAGRAAGLTDVLGHASSRTASAELESLATRQPFARILAALAEQPLGNGDLAKQLGQSEEHICRSLRTLRRLGGVAKQPRGREAYNLLTPIGRLLVERGLPAVRRPLEQSEVHHMGAWDMRNRTARSGCSDGATNVELPRLSAAQ